MNKEELAAKLNGSEYPLSVSMDLHDEAEESGLVIVYGQSDDLMEFTGAIDYEIGVCSGDNVLASKNGVVPKWESIAENDPKEDYCRKYFLNKNQSKPIKAIWGEGEYSWTYKTEIPHACFDVIRDGEKYCQGIIFHVDDIFRPAMNKHQENAIEALSMSRCEVVNRLKSIFDQSPQFELIVKEYSDEITAAIEWVKRQTGE